MATNVNTNTTTNNLNTPLQQEQRSRLQPTKTPTRHLSRTFSSPPTPLSHFQPFLKMSPKEENHRSHPTDLSSTRACLDEIMSVSSSQTAVTSTTGTTVHTTSSPLANNIYILMDEMNRLKRELSMYRREESKQEEELLLEKKNEEEAQELQRLKVELQNQQLQFQKCQDSLQQCQRELQEKADQIQQLLADRVQQGEESSSSSLSVTTGPIDPEGCITPSEEEKQTEEEDQDETNTTRVDSLQQELLLVRQENAELQDDQDQLEGLTLRALARYRARSSVLERTRTKTTTPGHNNKTTTTTTTTTPTLDTLQENSSRHSPSTVIGKEDGYYDDETPLERHARARATFLTKYVLPLKARKMRLQKKHHGGDQLLLQHLPAPLVAGLDDWKEDGKECEEQRLSLGRIAEF